jgi:hypothetical protein
MEEISSVGNNGQIFAALIKRWDIDYKKALECKLSKKSKRKSSIVKPIVSPQKSESLAAQTDESAPEQQSE